MEPRGFTQLERWMMEQWINGAWGMDGKIYCENQHSMIPLGWHREKAIKNPIFKQ
jgi:hypothetical protein